MPTNDNWPPPTPRDQAGMPRLEPSDKGVLTWLWIAFTVAAIILAGVTWLVL